ncbi:hypothetical protein [Haloglomus litoreum]|uniref:hypothetical protein n=1 Tax=Haloglomus litoreum TaxID=3034026 RepID=UPI0023E7DE06|nr:hypothetical protein [Haloglomus sp. DT116]
MREYDRAIGRLAGCCSALNASYRGFRNQRGQQIIEVRYRNGVFTIVSQPTDSYFHAIAARRLTNVDGFDITRSRPIVQVEDDLTALFDELETANIRIDHLTEMHDAEGIEYFDGYRTAKPLYVFEDGFGPRRFDESLAELNQIGRKAFERTLDRLELDLDEIEETTGSEDEPEETYGRAFQ